tara:strand:- start:601 stop:951 length:351 start_codon:yes stop_codon:yes gene_type:complete
MNKQILLILIALALNGCVAIKWNHPTKGYGNISTMFNPKGSNEFIRDYKDCGKIADRQVKEEEAEKKKARLAKEKRTGAYLRHLGKVSDPCLSDRLRIKCMKDKYGWKIKNKHADH